jgi:(1->4)-alpha-D-glucan 1-alpha-D-glucosylmutase
MRLNRTQRRIVDGDPAPDRNDEYRLYQILLGVWPAGLAAGLTQVPAELTERVTAYMLKAAREAKIHTSWLTTNQPYEDALTGFVERILGPSGGPRFLPVFLPFQQRIAAAAVVNSLAQVVLKLGSPGVPDFYQGTELWDLSLVDPDNRRPVDFDVRQRLLERNETTPSDPAELLSSWGDGSIKLFVTAAGLRLRRDLPEVFVGGEYLPLRVLENVSRDAAGNVAEQNVPQRFYRR